MLFSCQKEEFSNKAGVPAKLEIVKNLSVSDAEWAPEDGKSSFIAGTGITLSGTELISVFYAEGKDPVVASPLQRGDYLFSHEGVDGAEAYDYNYLMPHNAHTKADGTARLSAVQYPGMSTFDPAYDYLLGEPSLGVAKSESQVAINRFKRLTAPFNFVINDQYALLGNNPKIKVLTVDFSSLAVPVAADFTPIFSSEYSSAGIGSTVAGTESTALTAVFPEGLSSVGGNYDGWFSSLPVEMVSGQVVSLTVSTENATVTCKATIPSDYSLLAGKLNKIPFIMSRFKTDYLNVKSGTSTATVCLASNSETLAVTAPEGYVVGNLRVYADASSFASASTTAQLVLKSGETEVARKHFNLANTSDMNGGCVEFDGLASYSDLELSFYTSDSSTENVAVIAAMTTVFDEPAVPEFTFPERLVRCGGEEIVLPCTAPGRVTKVSLVSEAETVETSINSAANQKLTVSIPANAPQGVYDVKVNYITAEGQEVEKVIGTFSMALNAGDYYKWDNITVYAQNHSQTEKVFCLETGMMASIQWVKEHEILINMDNPGSAIGSMAAQPRGYHYIMLRGENSQLRLINPNANNYLNAYTPALTNYGLPQVRFSRIEKESYRQNTAYPAEYKGNTTHTPQSKEIALYDAIKSGSLTSAQWNALASDFGLSANDYGKAPNQSALSGNYINVYGHTTYHDMRLLFDNYNATINPNGAGTVTAGTKRYWNTVQEARDGWTESFHGGVVLWTANYGSNGNISWPNAQQLNGALELVSYTGGPDTGATQGSITMKIYRKKTWNESYYSYDPNMPAN